MNKSFNLIKISLSCLLALSFLTASFAQTAPKPPRQEKLLNGLKILMWNDASANSVTVKIRIHSGSAFDPQGKEGVMKLLAENIFPNDASREYFSEDLGGSLDISTNYDFTQINATAKPENILPMIETLARAVSAPTIDKETTAKLRTSQLEKLKGIENDRVYVADQAAAKRLFGTFPYGRPSMGTSDSVAKIDFADLILAKQRFLTADNATVAVTGNFTPDLVYRAFRRYFGIWEKSDKKIPATFRQPDEPETKLLMIPANAGGTEYRYTTRGWARNDKNYAASEILAQIFRNRSADAKTAVSIRPEAHILPGAVVFSRQTAAENAEPLKVYPTGTYLEPLLGKSVSSDEFAKAKVKILNDVSRRDLSDWWLDADTFRLVSVADEMQSFQNAALADVENLRGKLVKQPFATIIVMEKTADGAGAKN